MGRQVLELIFLEKIFGNIFMNYIKITLLLKLRVGVHQG